MTLLDVNNLSIHFDDTQAVKASSFSIAKGEVLALVGESGSGKSLTALSCLGLQPATARLQGSIRFDGQELAGAPQAAWRALRGKRIGMIFQEPMTALNPLHPIGRQIGEAVTTHAPRQSGGALRHQVAELLERVGLPYLRERLNAYPHELSGGERQRVMIAMAIANEPDLLIADEPTTAVDVTIQAKILELLQELQRAMGMAVLFITHDLTIVRHLADRVAVMHHGEIVEQGSVNAVFTQPRHAYTRQLLASEPQGNPVPVSAASPPILTCENLSVMFPIGRGFRTTFKTAVDQVSLAIPTGTTVGLVGESGSGKTTLGFALLRLAKSQGRIVFMGNPIDAKSNAAFRPMRKHLQIVFQDPYSSLNPRMNVRQLLEEGLRVHFPELNQPARQAQIAAMLVEVGLPAEAGERYPHEFSGGQRQRIGIARAMILNPSLVVLDEPTSALDLAVQAQILTLLKSLQQLHGLSYLFISHDLRVVKAIAHQLVVLHQGRVVESGETAAIFAQPRHDYTKTLIAASRLSGNVTE